MKIGDSIITPTPPMPSSSSSLLKRHKPTKPFKFNRRLNNRLASLSKSSCSVVIPIDKYQIIPVSSIWTNPQLMPPNPMIIPINTSPTSRNISSPPVVSPPSINQQPQNQPLYSSLKPFTPPRVTTTLIPLNVFPTQSSQTVESTATPLVNIIGNRQEQSISENKSNGIVTTHLIGDWIIRESSEPFQRIKNERLTPIKQIFHREMKDVSDKSINAGHSLPPNVHQWTTGDVSSFFERVLGKNSYTSIIKEQLIDGAALLLLEEEHLISIFKMQLGPRLKLRNRINKLKNGDLSGL